MNSIVKFTLIGIGAIAVWLLINILFAFPIKWCWNYTMPVIFKLPKIGVLHAFCLEILSVILFKLNVPFKD